MGGTPQRNRCRLLAHSHTAGGTSVTLYGLMVQNTVAFTKDVKKAAPGEGAAFELYCAVIMDSTVIASNLLSCSIIWLLARMKKLFNKEKASAAESAEI